MRARAATGDAIPRDAVEIVAETDDGKIIGHVTLWRESSRIYYCTNLFVDRAQRRQGVATKLMLAAEAYARERGAEIRVTIAEGNIGARAFFGATGWR